MLAEDLRDLAGLGGLPLFLLLVLCAWEEGEKPLAARLAAALAGGYVVSWACRLVHFRPRPRPQSFHGLLQRIDASSFPSIHAMRAAVLFTVLAHRLGATLLSVVFAVAIVLVAASRVWLGRHHVTDVIAGALIGLAMAVAAIVAPVPWRAG